MELATRFKHPEYLWLLLVVPAVWLLVWLLGRWRRRMLRQAGDPPVAGRMIEGVSRSRRRWKTALTLLGLFFLVLSLANFQQGFQKQKVQREGIDLMLALDVSKSMWVQDVSPNRLERARRFLWALLRQLKGDRVGLIVFAGRAYVQVPLTIDYGAVATLIQAAGPELVPTPGTAIGEAIDLAVERFEAVPSDRGKAIIIVSDGEDHMGDAEEAAARAREAGIKVFTVGVGTPEGGPVPIMRNGRVVGYKTDAQGRKVISRLNAEMLRKVARAGGGEYFPIDRLDDLLHALQQLERGKFETYETTIYNSYYQYTLVLAMLCFLLDSLLAESAHARRWWRHLKIKTR